VLSQIVAEASVTPTAVPSALPTFTVTPTWTAPAPLPSPTITVVASLTHTPALPTPTPTPEPTPTEEPTATTVPDTPTPVPESAPTPTPAAPDDAEPDVQGPGEDASAEEGQDQTYRIVHFKVLGEGENNGGIFDKGGQHLIFLTVLDENGNGLDGVVVKDDNGSNLEVITGSKGPGKAEISMEWDPYRLYVAADPSGPTTSEISNQMNTAFPHIPDIVGKLGSIDNEYSVCPTVDVRCTPPFYSVHFSYEITFQKVR
jgi:hypothetical protein